VNPNVLSKIFYWTYFYFTGHIFIILEVLFLCQKRNALDTGRKNHSTGKKNYFTWHLICRLNKIPHKSQRGAGGEGGGWSEKCPKTVTHNSNGP